jgi:hypothetical protein
VISIDPPAPEVAVHQTLTLTAICRNSKSDNVDINPTWTVENDSFERLSSTTGKIVTFTAGSHAGSTTISASYGGVKGSALLSVGVSSVTVSPLILLADNEVSSNLDSDGSNVIFYYFDTNDAAPWNAVTSDPGSGCPADPLKVIRVDYTNEPSGWGGFYLNFTSPQNLVMYTKLVFYVKGASGGERFLVGMSDGPTPASDVKLNIADRATVTTEWQKIEIPLSSFAGLSKSSVYKPLIIAFTDADTGGNATVYLDYFTFE